MLLFDLHVHATAKLVWMVLTLVELIEPTLHISITRIANLSGLSRPTVRKAIKELIAQGWYAPPTAGKRPVLPKLTGPRVPIPASLVTCTELGWQARLLYGFLQAIPSYKRYQGQFKYVFLAQHIPLCVKTIRRAAKELQDHGWLEIRKKEKHGKTYRLTTPGQTMLSRVTTMLAEEPYKGEALMKAWNLVLIKSDGYTDDARNGILRNPDTGKLMHFDRFYYAPRMVAFEFNGPQHYHRTTRYGAKTVCEQKHRDRIKEAICNNQRIPIITITREDLSLEAMKAKIGDLLPLRNLAEYEQAINFLEYKSKLYRAKNNPECAIAN